MLRALMIMSSVVRCPLGANNAIPQGIVCMGASTGAALGALHAGEGILAIAGLAAFVLGLLRLLEGHAQTVNVKVGTARMRHAALAAVLAASTGSAAAQERDATEAEVIRDALMEQRSAHEEGIEEFGAMVLERARTYQEDATSEAAHEQWRRAIVDTAADMGVEGFYPEDLVGPDNTGPIIYVLVSLSMPDEALRRYVAEAHELGAVVVIRGFIAQSFTATQARIIEVFGEDTLGGVAIDPRPFQAFGVERVPAIIYADGQVEPCGGLGCEPVVPEHDIVRGNISIAAALELFRREAPGMIGE